GAETVLEPEDRGRVDGQGLDRDDRVEALLDGQRRLVDEEGDRDDRVVGGEGGADTGPGQGCGRGQGASGQFDLGARGHQRPEDDVDALGGDVVGDLMALGAVVDDQSVPEFLGQADGRGDVVGAVAVLVPRELAVEDVGQGLLDQVTVERG